MWNYMIGISSKTVQRQNFKISIFDRMRFSLRFFYYILNNNKNMNVVLEKFDLLYNNYKDEILDDKTVDELLDFFEKVYKEIIGYWDLTLINDMYTFIWTYMFKMYLKIIKRMKLVDITNYITFNMEGVTDYASFMREAQRDPNFTKYIQEISLGRLNGNNSLKGNSIRFK